MTSENPQVATAAEALVQLSNSGGGGLQAPKVSYPSPPGTLEFIYSLGIRDPLRGPCDPAQEGVK